MNDTDFFGDYSNAMRVGEPGACYVPNGECATCGGTGVDDVPYAAEPCPHCYQGMIYVRRSYHTLSSDTVERLRTVGVGGGLATCLDCDKPIFVPGNADAGISVVGFLGAINLKGQ